mmetsp:Transcript_942/g.2348  ORF Transcript_942/g.2348 Transcript_942/m.2348 type:complete len:278 (+) Transcript_942:875-1708(+)
MLLKGRTCIRKGPPDWSARLPPLPRSGFTGRITRGTTARQSMRSRTPSNVALASAEPCKRGHPPATSSSMHASPLSSSTAAAAAEEFSPGAAEFAAMRMGSAAARSSAAVAGVQTPPASSGTNAMWRRSRSSLSSSRTTRSGTWPSSRERRNDDKLANVSKLSVAVAALPRPPVAAGESSVRRLWKACANCDAWRNTPARWHHGSKQPLKFRAATRKSALRRLSASASSARSSSPPPSGCPLRRTMASFTPPEEPPRHEPASSAALARANHKPMCPK